MGLHRVALCFVFLASLTFSRAEARDAAVDLELVLAVDVSDSIDARENLVQRAGYLAAIASPEFAAAVHAGALGRIRLSYVEWAGDGAQRVAVPWQVIDGTATAQAFAKELAAQPITRFRRGTSISSALEFSAGLFDGGGARRVIDISGDGPNNAGANVTAVRDAIVAEGIVINGLPVLIDPSPVFPEIDRYYADCVIGGDGAFSLPVASLSDMDEAILMKLLREVLLAGERWDGDGEIILSAAAHPTDCLAGERERARRTDQYYPELDR